MESEKLQFWTAVFLGFVVMILFAILTVNILNALYRWSVRSSAGSLPGNFAGKDFLNGAKAGLASGLLGLLAVSIDFMLNTGYLRAAIPHALQVAGVLFLIWAMIIYFPILAFIGGALGGPLKRFSKK